MARLLLALLLFSPVVLADARADYVRARDGLGKAYFDQLKPDDRDRLFEALLGWDHPEVVTPLEEVASRYGTYISGLEGKLAQLQTKVDRYAGRTGLTDQEFALRNSWLREMQDMEKIWLRALASQELLARKLGSLKDSKTLNLALRSLVKCPTWRVRQLLAEACPHWHRHLHDEILSRKVFASLKQLKGDKEPLVRVAAARALGSFRRAEAFELIKDSLRDGDWRVRAAAIKSLKSAKTSEAVGLLIEAMGRESGRLKDDINAALKEITGKDLVFADSWARWWRDVGGRLPAPGSEDPGPGIAPPKPKTRKPGHRFYGIRTRSEKICYVIDVSGSMNAPVEEMPTITGRQKGEERAHGKTRIEVAKNELKRAIQNLPSKSEFTIIFFNHALKVWRPKPIKATPQNKKDAIRDVNAVVASGATYTLGALRDSFRIAGALGGVQRTGKKGAGIDTIFLLSDGGPTDNKLHDPKPMEPDPILEQVRQWNKDTGIVIHTIAVHTQELGTYFLRHLANQNGGLFVERK